MSKIDIFPSPLVFRLKFGGVPFGLVDRSCWGLQRATRLGLSAVKLFSFMITIPQRHRRSEGPTTCLGNTALRVASRGKNATLNRNVVLKHRAATASTPSRFLFKQESCAIAKMTAQCALYMPLHESPEIFGTP